VTFTFLIKFESYLDHLTFIFKIYSFLNNISRKTLISIPPESQNKCIVTTVSH